MTPSRRNTLVEEALADEPKAVAALEATLLATRQAAGRRRQHRRRNRALTVLALLACGAWAATRFHPNRGDAAAIAQPSSPKAIDGVAAPPAFIPVSTRPEWAPLSVSTTPTPTSVVTTSAGTLTVVSTRSEAPPFTPATESDLFAAAGNRPAALQRLRDGSARWVWLDQRPRRR